MKILLVGWFSFEDMGASAGDIIARDTACGWLEAVGVRYDLALAPPFRGGVDWRTVNPGDYSDVLFVCGPVGNGPPLAATLERFREAQWLGLNTTMLHPLEDWNPFSHLIERGSNRTANPDLCFGAVTKGVPVVGTVLIDAQPEYGDRALHDSVHNLVAAVLESRDVGVVPIDTRLDRNSSALRSARQVESVIAKMDAVITTRLHGTVLSIKNNVPPVVIDSVSGGAKVSRQASVLRWPVRLSADTLSRDALEDALDFCLTEEARALAAEVASEARARIRQIEIEFKSWFGNLGDMPDASHVSEEKLDGGLK